MVFHTVSPRNYRGTTALITGANSGIGEEFAHQFASRGAHLVLVARREERLRALAERVEKEYGIKAHVLAHDLTEPDSINALTVKIAERGLNIDSLVNNAGFGSYGEFSKTDPLRLEQLITLNVTALTMLTRALLPRLLESGRGVLINIASTGAYQPLPLMAAYGASKAYVLSLTEAIAEETRNSGLRVLALSPGPTSTEFFEVAGENTAVGSFETPQQVVAVAFAALDKQQPRSVVSGARNKALAAAVKFLPRRAALVAARKAIETARQP